MNTYPDDIHIRRKAVCIPQDGLPRLMLGKARLEIPGLPHTAQCTGVYFDPARMAFLLRFIDASFSPKPSGAFEEEMECRFINIP